MLLRGALEYLRRLWRRWRSPAAPPPAPLLLAAPRARPQRAPLDLPEVICLPGEIAVPAKPRKRRERYVASAREAILDRLDNHMRMFRRIRQIDQDTYDLYSRIGVRILPVYFDRTNEPPYPLRPLEPWFAKTMPAFGMVTFAMSNEDLAAERERGHGSGPRYLAFHRYGNVPARVQPTNATVYIVNVFFDWDREDHRRGMYSFAVELKENGEVGLLRIMLDETQVIRSRKHGISHVHHQRWGLPPELLLWAADNKQAAAPFLISTFLEAVELWQLSHAEMTHITATDRSGLTAAFAIPPNMTAQFFRDRDTVLAPSGRRAPCFHIVRTHQRTLRDGRQTGVKLHFSGLRAFRWHNFDIRISVPGKDHADLAEWNAPAMDTAPEDVSPGLIDQAKLGRILQNHIRHGWKALQRSARSAA